MASIYQLKPYFQGLLRPLVKWLAAGGVTANQVTLGAMGLSIAWGIVLTASDGATWALLGLPVVLFIRMALNAIDGMLAREHGQASKLGAILNEMGDIVSDTVLYLPFAVFWSPIWGLPVILFLWAEAAGILPQAIGGERRYDGPMGKSDRAVAYGGLAVATVFLPIGTVLCTILVTLLCFLAFLTIYNRIRRGLDA